MRNNRALGAILAVTALLAACDSNPAASGTAPQGAKPEGTISDELPDLDLLANDAPLADPADQGIVPGVGAAPVVPGEAAEAAVPATAEPTPAAPPSVEQSDDSVGE